MRSLFQSGLLAAIVATCTGAGPAAAFDAQSVATPSNGGVGGGNRISRESGYLFS
jgi:hypothetical protein